MNLSASDLYAIESRLGARNYKPLDVTLTRGAGVWVWDTEGKRYLDCLSAYSALNQGHCHPKILAAMTEQAARLTLTSRAFRNDQLPLLYQDLEKLTGAKMILPMNSGVEAVESALKVTRKWGYEVKGVKPNQANIVTCTNNFHGRTLGVIGFSTDPLAQANYGPFAAGFKTVPFGDADAFAAALDENTVGCLIEPIQGEAGVLIPPAGYLKRVRELCTERNIVLILDEIQTGLGRTGKLLAQEHEGVRSDLTLLGKALSGGFYPVSAVLANNDVLKVLQPGTHGSTFGGNPLACAIARAALRVLVEEGMIENARVQGEYFINQLRAIKSDLIKEVRGRGLMIAIELKPEAGGAYKYCDRLREKGLLAKDTHVDTMRLAPPLVIGRAEIDFACETVASVLK